MAWPILSRRHKISVAKITASNAHPGLFWLPKLRYLLYDDSLEIAKAIRFPSGDQATEYGETE